jgi:hypothetical protein
MRTPGERSESLGGVVQEGVLLAKAFQRREICMAVGGTSAAGGDRGAAVHSDDGVAS